MRSAIALALLLVLTSRSGAAQAPPPALDSIGAGCCTVRVTGAEGRAEGTFQGKPAPGRITLTPCKGNLCPPAGGTQGSVTVPAGARVEMYAGRSAGKGAIWGAAIGAVLTTVIFLGDQDSDASTGEKIAIGIPVGALAGGGIGALVGALFPRWKPVRP